MAYTSGKLTSPWNWENWSIESQLFRSSRIVIPHFSIIHVVAHTLTLILLLFSQMLHMARVARRCMVLLP